MLLREMQKNFEGWSLLGPHQGCCWSNLGHATQHAFLGWLRKKETLVYTAQSYLLINVRFYGGERRRHSVPEIYFSAKSIPTKNGHQDLLLCVSHTNQSPAFYLSCICNPKHAAWAQIFKHMQKNNGFWGYMAFTSIYGILLFLNHYTKKALLG